MKWFCLDNIRQVERLLTGSNRMIVIYDPQGTIKHPDLLNNIYICYETQQLSSLHNTACLLVLMTTPGESFLTHEETCIVSFSKLKKSVFNKYHYHCWHNTVTPDGACYLQGYKQKRTAGLLNKWAQVFDTAAKTYAMHIYYKQPLHINKQLEDISFDRYVICINFDHIDIHLELQDKRFAYVKFAWNYRDQIALYEETEAIRKCSSLLLSYFVHPEVMKYTQNMLVLTDPKTQETESENTPFSRIHLEALKEIYYQTHTSLTFESSVIFREISRGISQIGAHEMEQERELITIMQNQLIGLLMHMDEKMTIETAQAHNNFTTQHTFIRQERLFVHEFSCTKNNYPMLYDAFQYVFYQEAVAGGKKYADIKQTLQTLKDTPWMQEFLADNNLDFSLYFQLYLLFQIGDSLKRYTQYPHIHTIHKPLIMVWNDALADVLTSDMSYDNLAY